MPRLLETYTPLRMMRDATNGGKGMSAQEVADALVREINAMGIPEEAKTYAWVLRFEERGTRDRYIVKGLAKIYNKSEDEVAQAATQPLQDI